MHATLKPIPTRYAGCHFRSRLEARWAVFFDHLDIEWVYEEQGYTVTNRLQLDGLPDSWNYLPDFWLPALGVWAEVKGSLTAGETRRLLSAAASLSSNDGGGCHDAGGHDMVALGPIPKADRRSARPIRLHMHKGDLIESGWDCGDFDGDPHGWLWSTDFTTHYLFADDAGNVYKTSDQLLHGHPDKVGDRVASAYAAARSARFEHGQRG